MKTVEEYKKEIEAQYPNVWSSGVALTLATSLYEAKMRDPNGYVTVVNCDFGVPADKTVRIHLGKPVDSPDQATDDISNVEDRENGAESGKKEEEDELVAEIDPLEVNRRVFTLKNIAVDVLKLDAQFNRELNELECKYLRRFKPHYRKRRDIISGVYEPTDKECNTLINGFHMDPETNEQILVNYLAANPGHEKVKGVPDFWFKIFKNSKILNNMVQAQDEPILKHLVDITVKKFTNPMSYTLRFHFSPNEYFSNRILIKTFQIISEPDAEDPLHYKGREFSGCWGCKIKWLEGKNVTAKVIQKRQRIKWGGKLPCLVNKTVNVESFFNFFSHPSSQGAEIDDKTDKTWEKSTKDFEIGEYFREKIIPHAVLYYTGEAYDIQYDYAEEEEEKVEEEEDEEVLDDEDEDNDKDLISRH